MIGTMVGVFVLGGVVATVGLFFCAWYFGHGGYRDRAGKSRKCFHANTCVTVESVVTGETVASFCSVCGESFVAGDELL